MSNGERNIVEHDIKQKGLKDMRRLYKVEKKKDNGINDNALKDMRIMFESDNKDYYQPVRFTNAFDDNFIEYESNGDKDKRLSIEEYLDKIRPYFINITNNLKTQGEWKIQSTIAVSLSSSKNSNKTRTMHSKSDNIEIMIGSEKNEIIDELFDSLLQKKLRSFDERQLIYFDSVYLLHYKCFKLV